jgi:hypothetical protein
MKVAFQFAGLVIQLLLVAVNGQSSGNVDLAAPNTRDLGEDFDDFFDTTMGYCEFSKLDVVAIDILMDSDVATVESFLDFCCDGKEEVISDLKPFVKLVRSYINPEFKDLISDRQILSAMMRKTLTEDTTSLTAGCESAIAAAVRETTRLWMGLMEVGSIASDLSIQQALASDNGTSVAGSMGLDAMADSLEARGTEGLGDASLNDVETNLPLFLEIFQSDQEIFGKFVATLFLKADIIGVKEVLDAEFPFFVNSWKEAVATSASFAARYAAFNVTAGFDLIKPFFEQNIGSDISPFYQNAIDICAIVSPTASPSAAPTRGVSPTASPTAVPTRRPTGFDEFVPCIAVIEQGGPSEAALSSSWAQFRSTYPERPFCLLQVRPSRSGAALAPADFVTDDGIIFRKVNRDMNMEFDRSDWFDLCNLYGLNPEQGDRLALLLDVAVSHVQASYNSFLSKLVANGVMRVDVMTREDSNWIQPFIRSFYETPAPSAAPTMAPTASSEPSQSPSRAPSQSPTQSAAPTGDAPTTPKPTPLPTPSPTTPLPTPSPTTPRPTSPPTTPRPTPDTFDIDLAFVGSPNQERIARVIDARDNIANLFTSGIPSAVTNNADGLSTDCGGDPPFVDDLFICVSFTNLQGSILGLAGPRKIKVDPVTGTFFPYTGNVRIDVGRSPDLVYLIAVSLCYAGVFN